MMRRSVGAVTAGFAAWMCAADAAAGPALIATRPSLDPQSGEYVAFVGGIDENGRSLKVSSVEVMASGERTPLVASTQSLSDWAAQASEHGATWRPPLVVGLVYLWVKGVPRGVLDGIHAFFQRVPSRTTVLPTVYGRKRQGRASLIAADISRLDEEVPPLENYRPNLIDAVRLDLVDLAVHPAPIKILVVVTDGRDFADPKGQGPGDFAALGREIRKAGVTALLVGYPPEADALQSAANLRELRDAAGGFLRVLDQPEDLENTLESLGQAIGDLQHVQFASPWSWRALGASRRVSLRLVTGSGKRLNAEAGSIEVPAGSFLIVAISIAVVFIAMLAVGVALVRRRRGSRAHLVDNDTIVTAAHDLIRRGTSPERAVEELSRAFAETVLDLVDLDPEVMNDPRFPYFRTRLGRQRMQEIRDLLANKSAGVPELAPVIAQVLAAAVSDRTTPELAAETMSARASVDECTAFAAMKLEQLAQALSSVAREHIVLGTPRARGVAVAIQDALRLRGSNRRGIVVGWLVRSAGSGRRGETLRIGEGRTVLGAASECQIQIGGDPGVVPQHAEVRAEAGEFVLVPLGGTISVEGTAVHGRHVLSDGETLQLGRGMFVFKSATVGNLNLRAASRPQPRPSIRNRSG
jgi:hypothetical protein